MRGSVTRETIQATKYFFFWSCTSWLDDNISQKSSHNTIDYFCVMLRNTQHSVWKSHSKIWCKVRLLPALGTFTWFSAYLQQLFLTAQMKKNSSTKERLIKSGAAVVSRSLLVKTSVRRRLNVSSMHGWMDMDIFTCRTSFSTKRTHTYYTPSPQA